MKFAVTIVSPLNYVHAAAFTEIAETVHFALKSLGYDSVLTTEGNIPGRQHVILGSNLLPHYPLPIAPDAILYNLEQVDRDSNWFSPALIKIFKSHRLWDYSEKNVSAFKEYGVNIDHVVPVGYVKELTRIRFVKNPDIDVLFFGIMNPRRKSIIDQMSLNLKVGVINGTYGKRRDALIGRSKLIINIHYYEVKVLEMVRLSYLLANHCAVLSERSSEHDLDDLLEEGVAFSDYKDLANRARELIDSPDERAKLSKRGFEIISARSAIEYLREAVKTISN